MDKIILSKGKVTLPHYKKNGQKRNVMGYRMMRGSFVHVCMSCVSKGSIFRHSGTIKVYVCKILGSSLL